MKKITAILAAACLMLMCCCSPSQPADTPSGDESGSVPAQSSSVQSGDETGEDSNETAEFTYYYCEIINDDSVVVPLSAPDQCLYYRESLISDESDLTWAYDEIVYAAAHLANPSEGTSGVSEVYFRESISEAELQEVFEAVFLDHPELWFLNQPDKNGCVLSPQSDRLAYLFYAFDIAEIPALDKDIQSAANEILSKCGNLTHAIDKVGVICGYMYDNCSLFWGVYNENGEHSSIKEMLLEHGGVCVGFAATTTFLLQKSGVWAITGSGKTSTDVAHCWSIVADDGLYKYIDNYNAVKNGGGIEHSIASYFLFDTRKVYDEEHITIRNGVLLPGSPIGAGIVMEGSDEPDVSSDADVSSEADTQSETEDQTEE